MLAVCVNSSGTLSLKKDREYYVFPGCPQSFYVSKFNSSKAHFGCFQKDRFKVIDESLPEAPPTAVAVPEEPVIRELPPSEPEEEHVSRVLNNSEHKYFKAVVDTEDPWWKNGKEYILSVASLEGHYNVHRTTDGFIIATLNGEKFKILEPCELPEKKKAPVKKKPIETESGSFEQLSLF